MPIVVAGPVHESVVVARHDHYVLLVPHPGVERHPAESGTAHLLAATVPPVVAALVVVVVMLGVEVALEVLATLLATLFCSTTSWHGWREWAPFENQSTNPKNINITI